MSVKKRIKLFLFKRKWIHSNQDNTTKAINMFNINKVHVGRGTYGGLEVYSFNDNSDLFIGNFCSIGPKTVFLLDADHTTNCLTTYPFKVKFFHQQKGESLSKGNICIDDDVWIGYGATIMSGVHIGQGAVIAAGAVVTTDVPPYTIVGGIPAKVLKNRFDNSIVEYLLTLDYNKLSNDDLKLHIDDLYKPITCFSLEEIKNTLKWFPKK